MHRTKATFIGLLEAGRANEWVVTEKLGDATKNKSKKPRFTFKIGDRQVVIIFGLSSQFLMHQHVESAEQAIHSRELLRVVGNCM